MIGTRDEWGLCEEDGCSLCAAGLPCDCPCENCNEVRAEVEGQQED